MTEEQIKNWARKKANALEENQTLGIYDRDEDMRYDESCNDGQVSGYEEGLIDGYHEGFKDCAKARLNVTTISDCPIKDDWHYVKDGDLPTEITEKTYLVALKSKYGGFFFETDIWCNSLHCFASNNPTKVYAWKEIDLFSQQTISGKLKNARERNLLETTTDLVIKYKEEKKNN